MGSADSPEAVAGRIFTAAARGRRLLVTGRVGKAASRIHRFAPRLYEYLMLRGIRSEKGQSG